MARAKSLVFGVGVNDADYFVESYDGGIRNSCPFYRKWKDMLTRCYSKKFHSKNPSYIGCSVCAEWLIFSKFKSWMEKQSWEGMDLDKDIIFVGNKIYSPENCAFVPSYVNKFVLEGPSKNPCGTNGNYFNKKIGKFVAQCKNPLSGKREYLGLFANEADAAAAWKSRKHQISMKVAYLQSDQRVAMALMVRFA